MAEILECISVRNARYGDTLASICSAACATKKFGDEYSALPILLPCVPEALLDQMK